jgi:hypothetical protein
MVELALQPRQNKFFDGSHHFSDSVRKRCLFVEKAKSHTCPLNAFCGYCSVAIKLAEAKTCRTEWTNAAELLQSEPMVLLGDVKRAIEATDKLRKTAARITTGIDYHRKWLDKARKMMEGEECEDQEEERKVKEGVWSVFRPTVAGTR